MLLRIIIILLMIAIIPFEWKAIENHTSNACDPTISDVKTESNKSENFNEDHTGSIGKEDEKKTSEEETAHHLTLSQIQQKFPHGKYWNHYKNQENDPDVCTDDPCIHTLHGASGPCVCNKYGYYSQCYGFIMKVTLDYYGSTMKEWTWSHNLDKIKAGDVLIFKISSSNGIGHPIWVTDVNDEVITYADCNANSNCNIRWNQTIKKSAVKMRSFTINVAPYKMKEVNEKTELHESHIINEKYSSDFPAKANCYMTVFDENKKSVGNIYLKKGEECTVNEVYTDGCCKITFSLYRKEVTYYCFLADINPVSLLVSRIDRTSEKISEMN